MHRSLRMRTVRAPLSAGLLLAALACATERAADTAADTPADTISADVAGSRAVFEEARRRGVDFRAVGQEPGWTLDIDTDVNGVIDFRGDYGATRLIAPRPQRMTGEEGDHWYQIATDTHTLQVEIRKLPCEDTMSGELFSHTVTVDIDGRTLPGCGRVLGAYP